MPEPRNTT